MPRCLDCDTPFSRKKEKAFSLIWTLEWKYYMGRQGEILDILSCDISISKNLSLQVLCLSVWPESVSKLQHSSLPHILFNEARSIVALMKSLLHNLFRYGPQMRHWLKWPLGHFSAPSHTDPENICKQYLQGLKASQILQSFRRYLSQVIILQHTTHENKWRKTLKKAHDNCARHCSRRCPPRAETPEAWPPAPVRRPWGLTPPPPPPRGDPEAWRGNCRA